MFIRPSNVLSATDDYVVAEVDGDIEVVPYNEISWAILDESDRQALDEWGLV